MSKQATPVPEKALPWIGGAWVDSARTRISINPSTNEPVGAFAVIDFLAETLRSHAGGEATPAFTR